ncbi:MAG TPA: hypothetical protein VF276_16655, partial [Chloroflexia bacterium]
MPTDLSCLDIPLRRNGSMFAGAGPFPDPPGAPVEWRRDAGRFPAPLTPMYYSTYTALEGEGRRRVAALYADPALDRPLRRINTYAYVGSVPAASPETQAARMAGSPARITAVLDRLDDLWTHRWRPELAHHLAVWDGFDLARAGLPALMAYLDESLRRGARLWELYFLLDAPARLALAAFARAYAALGGPPDPLTAQRLSAGGDDKMAETDRALADLGREARATPPVADILLAGGPDVCARLDALPAGRTFLGSLGAFLYVYGRRSPGWDWGYPAWLEDPAPVLAALRADLAAPARDCAAEQVAARERALAEARERARRAPAAVAAEFACALPLACAARRIREDARFYVVLSGMYRVRRVILECGRLLQAAGLLGAAGDVFALTLDELRATAQARPPADLRVLAALRQAEMAHWA